jgi:hypothetical protein
VRQQSLHTSRTTGGAGGFPTSSNIHELTKMYQHACCNNVNMVLIRVHGANYAYCLIRAL